MTMDNEELQRVCPICHQDTGAAGLVDDIQTDLADMPCRRICRQCQGAALTRRAWRRRNRSGREQERGDA